MKRVVSTSEVPHLWAHQSQDSARNGQGSLYFDGDTIYSYGSHFPVARHVTGAHGRSAVLLTSRSHSITTARHVSGVHSAIPGSVPVFCTDSPRSEPGAISKDKGAAVAALIAKLEACAAPKKTYKPLRKTTLNLVSFEEPVKAFAGRRLALNGSGRNWTVTHIASGYSTGADHLTWEAAREVLERLDKMTAWDKVPATGALTGDLRDKLWDATRKAEAAVARLTDVDRHPAAIAKLWVALQEAIQDANGFNIFFGFKARYGIPDSIEPLRPIVFEYQAKAAERSAERERSRRSRYAARAAEMALSREERAAKWRAGEYVSYLSDVPTMLRIKGDTIETSMGAEFPVAHAKHGVAAVRAVLASGTPYQSNGHTIHLGVYTLDKIDTDGTVHAGCHHVPLSEVERIAAELGL